LISISGGSDWKKNLISSANNFLSCSPNVLSNHGQRSIVSITAYVSWLGSFFFLLLY
jgi:hypothetical protein